MGKREIEMWGRGALGGEDVLGFVDALRDFAERVVHSRSLLTSQDAGDITDQAFLELVESFGPIPPLPTPGEARRAISRVADRIRKRRKRRAVWIEQVESEANRMRRGRHGERLHANRSLPLQLPKRPTGVPPLCRRLAALGRGTRFEAEIQKLVVDAAAVAVAEPSAFSADQIALFTLAWRRGRSASAIVGVAGTRTPRAVTERLKRLTRRIEEHLLEDVSATLPPSVRKRLAGLLSGEPISQGEPKPATHVDTGVYECVIDALKDVVHRLPS